MTDLLVTSVAFSAVLQVGVLVLLVRHSYRGVRERRSSRAIVVGLSIGAAALAALLTGHAVEVVPALLLTAAAALALCSQFPDDSAAQHLYVTNRVLATLLTALILVHWAHGAVAGVPARAVALAACVLAILLNLPRLVNGLVFDVASLRQLFRKRFLRPTSPLPPRREPPFPKVTLHLPCHAEPPDVVLATLDALARLRYPSLEVLVVDNNTEDAELWRPVEAHCALLGPRFRFFHVDSLEGAKGGALNFAAHHTSPDTEIIGSLDADYVCDPDFVERLVGFFDDPEIAYVQTPHGHRNGEGRRYLRCCHEEYRVVHELFLPGLNEWSSACLIGTMCLIRRRAFDEAGGSWSNTCLTEDSELSLRLLARGWKGIFLGTIFGRGLIPETFAQYKQQRFRWIAGNVQQRKVYWQALSRRRSGPVAALSWIARVTEAGRCLGALPSCATYPLAGLIVLGAVALAIARRSVPVPPTLVVLAATAIGSWLVKELLRSRLLQRGFVATVAAEAARLALHHTCVVASMASLLSRRPLAWNRTGKFAASSSGYWRALLSVRSELVLGLLALVLGGALLAAAGFVRLDATAAVALALLYVGLRWLCAPFLALLAEADLRALERGQASLAPQRRELAPR